MKTYLSIGIAFVFAAAAAAACGPSQPANTGDDGTTTEPTATATATATSEAGGAGTGGSEAGGAGTGGTTETATATATSTATAGTTGTATATATTTGPTSAEPPAKLVAAGDPANGKKLFEANNCNGCHGTKDKPNAKFPNLYKIKWDEKEINHAFDLVKKGKAPMPPYGDKLQDKQIGDIVAFLKQGGK
ncbi:MAG: cytochrome c [Polyangiaceae bacterium]|nr:cytochrome c [Polyangiaceae bacterium]